MRIFMAVCFCLFSSCAYRVGYQQKSLPGNYKQIAIPTFKNLTPEVGIESYFTNSLLEEFIRVPFVKVISQAKSEAVIEGQILSVKYEKGAVISGGGESSLPEGTSLASSYTVTVAVQVSLREVSSEKIIWSSSFSASKIYQAAQIGAVGSNTANPLYNYSAKQNTIRDLSKQLMAKAFTRMTESF